VNGGRCILHAWFQQDRDRWVLDREERCRRRDRRVQEAVREGQRGDRDRDMYREA
jgi:hypothetical protein